MQQTENAINGCEDEDEIIGELSKPLHETNARNQEFDKSEFVDYVIDKAASLISLRFFNSGLYQFISFVLIGIAWTVGSGWYVFVSVFSGKLKLNPKIPCLNE